MLNRHGIVDIDDVNLAGVVKFLKSFRARTLCTPVKKFALSFIRLTRAKYKSFFSTKVKT